MKTDAVFDVEKIVIYLNQYKNDLHKLYNWNAKIDKLIDLGVFNLEEIDSINDLTSYEKEIRLKSLVGKKLNSAFKENKDLFLKISLWIIKDWGGIKTANDNETKSLIEDFIKSEMPSFNRIASTSKVGSYLYPEKNIIYDSRVAYALNWIILSQNAGKLFFPIPQGRNSKMSALDMNVLIRLNNISSYIPKDKIALDNRFFIKNTDKKIFIDKKCAYLQLNNLIKKISKELWVGDVEKQNKLYYTEMLLFSIADKEIFMDIATTYSSMQ
jgi:hypothetical protein